VLGLVARDWVRRPTVVQAGMVVDCPRRRTVVALVSGQIPSDVWALEALLRS
jgi:hypothetical protein